MVVPGGSSSPSLARDKAGRLLHGQAKSLFDVGSATTLQGFDRAQLI
jgi:hypothetical protein